MANEYASTQNDSGLLKDDYKPSSVLSEAIKKRRLKLKAQEEDAESES